MVKQSTRAVIALLIAAGSFASLVAAAGAGEEIDKPTVPDGFTVPRPAPGDAGRYDYLHVQDTPDGPVAVGEVLPYLEFGYHAESNFLDRNGTARAVLVETLRHAGYHAWATSQTPNWRFWDATLHYNDLATHDTLAWQRSYPMVGQQNPEATIITPGGEGRIVSDNTEFRWYHDFTRRVSEDCLLQHRLNFIEITEKVELFRWCTMPLENADPQRPTGLSVDDISEIGYPAWPAIHENVTFQLVAVSEWQNRSALVYRQDPITNADPDDEEFPRMDVWFADGLAYPVRVQQIEPDADGLRRVWTLAEFSPGQEVRMPAGKDAPNFVYAPIKPWGPDATGWTRFDPEEAWQIALDDGRMATELAKPGAARAVSQFNDRTDDEANEYQESWEFAIRISPDQNGLDMDAFKVTRTWTDPAMAVPYGLGPEGELELNPTDEVTVRKWGSSYYEHEPKAKLPTLVSALERWSAFSGFDANVDRLAIRYDHQEGPNGGLTVTGNEQVYYAELYEGQIQEKEGWDSSYVHFDWNGVVSAHLMSDQIRSAGVVGLPNDVKPDEEAKIVPAATVAFVWETPTTETILGAGVVGLILAALYYFWPLIKSGVLGLFSRIHQDSVLDHPVRQQMFDAIKEQPGIHTQALVRAVGSGYGSTQHHLDKLVSTGKVARAGGKGYMCYFPKATDRRVMAAAPAIRSDTARQILLAIIAGPGVSGGDLAASIGINRATVSHHTKRLQAAGVVELRRDGQAIRAFPTQVAEMLRNAIAA